MDKGQQEYYLREQMHIISEELGDSEDTRAEADTYREKIRALALDEESTESCSRSVTVWPVCRAVAPRAA